MTLGEKIKMHRTTKGLSQEKVAEKIGVSRQAVTKWENNQSVPSSENLIALAEIYGISLDELTGIKNSNQTDAKEILHTNLTLIAIILQASFLNASTRTFPTADYAVNLTIILFKLIPLFACSVWMAHNLRYEKNMKQYKKNVKIELVYCIIQAVTALFAYYNDAAFLGTLLILTNVFIYIFVVNPKYMNRPLTKRKQID